MAAAAAVLTASTAAAQFLSPPMQDPALLPASPPVFAAIDFAPGPSPAANVTELVGLIRKAAEQRPLAIVLPEHAIVGRLGVETLASSLWEMSCTQAYRRIGLLAKELRIPIALGLPQRVAGGGIVIGTLLFARDGRTLLNQAKLAASVENGDGTASAGDFHYLETSGLDAFRVGVSSGADLEKTIPRLADLGAQVILISASWRPTEAEAAIRAARALASERGVALAIAAAGGRSAVLDGSGKVAARLREGEHIAAATLRLAALPAVPLGLPPAVLPARASASPGLADLGRELFSDATWAGVACAGCHNPARAYAGDRAPTLLNAMYRTRHGSRGDVPTLEAAIALHFRAEGPIPRDLGRAAGAAASAPAYAARFHDLPGPDGASHRLIDSLAAFVRTLVSGDSAFDRFHYASQLEALSPGARRGLYLFAQKGGCSRCHLISPESSLFTDNKVHGGVATPSLRDAVRTAPYMSDHSLPTLESVIDFYDRGGRSGQPLQLTHQQKSDLVEFLKSLTGAPVATPVLQSHSRSASIRR
jgi:cytochrome c peroxidase